MQVAFSSGRSSRACQCETAYTCGLTSLLRTHKKELAIAGCTPGYRTGWLRQQQRKQQAVYPSALQAWALARGEGQNAADCNRHGRVFQECHSLSEWVGGWDSDGW
jgi:hypothetical protein